MKRYFAHPPKIPKQYFVDIVTLPKHTKPKKTAKKEKHKIAANIQRKGVAKSFGKQEKIPLKTMKITPKIIAKLQKQQENKLTIPPPKAKQKSKTPKKRGYSSSKTKKRNKKKLTKKPKTIKITGGLYNPNAVLSNKTTKGSPFGKSKEYKYKNAKREATITLGTQSLKYASYMQHIKDKIQNVWIYPQEAQETGEQGRLLILFSIGKNGKVLKISLLRSSGFGDLDDAAMEAIRDASPFPPLPKRFHLDILNIYATFEYRLNFYYVE